MYAYRVCVRVFCSRVSVKVGGGGRTHDGDFGRKVIKVKCLRCIRASRKRTVLFLRLFCFVFFFFVVVLLTNETRCRRWEMCALLPLPKLCVRARSYLYGSLVRCLAGKYDCRRYCAEKSKPNLIYIRCGLSENAGVCVNSTPPASNITCKVVSRELGRSGILQRTVLVCTEGSYLIKKDGAARRLLEKKEEEKWDREKRRTVKYM